MPQTITRVPALPAPIVPDVMDTASYDVSATSGNQLHEIPGRPDPEVSLRVAGSRAGSIALTFTSRADALTAFARHREVGIFTLTDTDVPEMGMTYVVAAGAIRCYLDPQTLLHWHVTFPFREVVP